MKFEAQDVGSFMTEITWWSVSSFQRKIGFRQYLAIFKQSLVAFGHALAEVDEVIGIPVA